MSALALRLRLAVGQGPDGPLFLAERCAPGAPEAAVLAEALPLDFAPGSLDGRRIADAARLQARIGAPTAVRSRALFRVGPRWWLISAPVAGVSLAARLREGPTPVSATLEVGAELAAALAELSQAGPAAAPRCPGLDDLWVEPGVGLRALHFGRRGAAYLAPELALAAQPAGGPAELFALCMLLCSMLEGRSLPPLLPDLETWDLRVEALAARCAAGAGPLSEPLKALLIGGLAARPEARPSIRAVERALFDLRARIDAPPLAAVLGGPPRARNGEPPLEDAPLGVDLEVVDALDLDEDAPAELAPTPSLNGPRGAAPAPPSDRPPAEPDEVLDPAEVQAPVSQRRAARPAPKRAELPLGPAPADPSATFVGDRRALLEGLASHQDTQIRAIPKALQRGRPPAPPELPPPSAEGPSEPPELDPPQLDPPLRAPAAAAPPAIDPPIIVGLAAEAPALGAEPGGAPRRIGPAPSGPLGAVPPPPPPPSAPRRSGGPAGEGRPLLLVVIGVGLLGLLGAALVGAAAVAGLLP